MGPEPSLQRAVLVEMTQRDREMRGRARSALPPRAGRPPLRSRGTVPEAAPKAQRAARESSAPERPGVR
jgi:hypothetical protein